MPAPCRTAAIPRKTLTTLVGLVSLAACSGGGGSTPSRPAAPATASEAEWQALATARPTPMENAARVAVGELELLADNPWEVTAPVPLALGISELVVAGLLRRGDVQLVERRRFVAAADAERRGETRPQGAPPAGVSPGAEFILMGTWSAVGLPEAYLDLRLTDAEDGSTVVSWRTTTPNDADPTALARAVIGSLLETLGEMQRLPAWSDPAGSVIPESYRASGIGLSAVEAFLDGLAAEDQWDWEGARRGYQAALAEGGRGFVEAAAALARTARLRNGGTLGASQ